MEEDMKSSDECNVEASLQKGKQVSDEEGDSHVPPDPQSLPPADKNIKESCSQSIKESKDQCDGSDVTLKTETFSAASNVKSEVNPDLSGNDQQSNEIVNETGGKPTHISMYHIHICVTVTMKCVL